jgi:catechol 2,3-dioxygenase-like lactoylglutathione lyase family enzyme
VLIFNPDHTSSVATAIAGSPIPLHGARGAGHLAFAVREQEIPAWRAHLKKMNVVIESEVHWPQGGTSIYIRDPAGNSIELATATIWGLPEA